MAALFATVGKNFSKGWILMAVKMDFCHVFSESSHQKKDWENGGSLDPVWQGALLFSQSSSSPQSVDGCACLVPEAVVVAIRVVVIVAPGEAFGSPVVGIRV